METTPPIVLVVGATGMLGGQIVQSLIQQGRAAEVRATHRPEKTDDADAIREMGATPVEADLLRPDTLPGACEGAGVVVSAVSGPREPTVEGQKNLIAAAEEANVRRLIPSDYSVDFFNLDYGDNYNLDMRKEVAEALAESSLEATHVLNGAFADVALNDRSFQFDLGEGVFGYYGDGEQPCDFTTVADTARYTAAAATDPDAPEVLRVAGDVLTMKEFGAAYNAGMGRDLRPQSLGTLEDLEAEIEERKAGADSPMEYVMHQYHWAMVTGKGKLDPLENGRYPRVEPQGVEAFLRQQRTAESAVA